MGLEARRNLRKYNAMILKHGCPHLTKGRVKKLFD